MISVAAPSAAGVAARPLPAGIDLLALHRANPERYPVLLESAASGGGARWDMLLCTEGEGFERDAAGQLRDLDGRPIAGTFLAALDRAAGALGEYPATSAGWPFRGGWALFLGYELAAEIEPRLRLPAPPYPMPQALALRCPAAVLVDRLSGETVAVAEAERADLLDAITADVLALAGRVGDCSGAVADAARSAIGPDIEAIAAPLPRVRQCREDDPQRFLAGVAQVRDYLAAGDVFQVNLSRAWSAHFEDSPEPTALYRDLRAANPAPFAGLFRQRDWCLLSSSPERLLAIRSGRIETRPIAGTFPRLAGEDRAARIAELVAHPKERAEHIMLIDLERNDLGRVCRPGSVTVDELMTVESYAHVHHIVSSVSGRLREGIGPGAAIAAVFPGGTITGCPKVRCMEIIAELEGEGRGAYTGAIGYLNRDGDMELNILIRTACLRGDRLHWRTGAGLVVDSDPDRELAETRAKARGLLRAWGLPE